MLKTEQTGSEITKRKQGRTGRPLKRTGFVDRAGNPISRAHWIVSQRIRDARVASGLTLEQAATRIGYSKSTLSNVETDKGQLDLQKLTALAKLYNVSVTYLVAGLDKVVEG